MNIFLIGYIYTYTFILHNDIVPYVIVYHSCVYHSLLLIERSPTD